MSADKLFYDRPLSFLSYTLHLFSKLNPTKS